MRSKSDGVRSTEWKLTEEHQVKSKGSLLLSLSSTEHIFLKSPAHFYCRRNLDSFQ